MKMNKLNFMVSAPKVGSSLLKEVLEKKNLNFNERGSFEDTSAFSSVVFLI